MELEQQQPKPQGMQKFQEATKAKAGEQRQDLEEKEREVSQDYGAESGEQTQKLNGKEKERPKEFEAEVRNLSQEFSARRHWQRPQKSNAEAMNLSLQVEGVEGKLLSRETARRLLQNLFEGEGTAQELHAYLTECKQPGVEGVLWFLNRVLEGEASLQRSQAEVLSLRAEITEKDRALRTALGLLELARAKQAEIDALRGGHVASPAGLQGHVRTDISVEDDSKFFEDLSAQLSKIESENKGLQKVLRDQASANVRIASSLALQDCTFATLEFAVARVTQTLSLYSNRVMEQYRCLVTLDQTLGPAFHATWAATFASEEDYRFGVSHIVMEVLFRDFENESFYCRGVQGAVDRADARNGHQLEADRVLLSEDPVGRSARFSGFLDQRYAILLQAFSSIIRVTREQVKLLLGGTGELWDCYLELVKQAWVLHELAFTFDQPAEIVRRVSGLEMDALCEPVEGCERAGFSDTIAMVIMPGFRVADVVISKCQVYRGLVPSETGESRVQILKLD
jgi:hypothetical protein